jgi:hypothetical protein
VCGVTSDAAELHRCAPPDTVVSKQPRRGVLDEVDNQYVKQLDDVLGSPAVESLLPALKRISRDYPLWSMTFRSHRDDVKKAVDTARDALAAWDSLDGSMRRCLSRVMPGTLENLRAFVRAFLPPSRLRGKPVNWPRRVLLRHVAIAMQDAGVRLETKHGGNLERTAKILLNAIGDKTHESLDLRRELTEVVEELSSQRIAEAEDGALKQSARRTNRRVQ